MEFNLFEHVKRLIIAIDIAEDLQSPITAEKPSRDFRNIRKLNKINGEQA